MKTLILVLVAALLVPVARAEEPALAKFRTQLEEAIQSKSTAGIAALVHPEGAAQIQIDQAVFRYEFSWNENTLVAVTFADVADPRYQQLVEKDRIVMNGNPYVRNLRPTKLCLVEWKNATDNKITAVSPIGIAPDGAYKFMLQVPEPRVPREGEP